MISTQPISIQQPFITVHHRSSEKELVLEKNKAAQMFVSYFFEKSLNQALITDTSSDTGDQLSKGSIFAHQQMNTEIARIIAQSSDVTKTITNQLK